MKKIDSAIGPEEQNVENRLCYWSRRAKCGKQALLFVLKSKMWKTGSAIGPEEQNVKHRLCYWSRRAKCGT